MSAVSLAIMLSRQLLLRARNSDQFDRIDTTGNTTRTGDSQDPLLRRGHATGGSASKLLFYKILSAGIGPAVRGIQNRQH